MEMTEEEFWQKVCIAAAAVPSSGGPHPAAMANDALKVFREKFRAKSLKDAEPDVRDIRSKCTKCGAVNGEDIDLTLHPEGTQLVLECDHCDTEYTYEVRIDNA